MIDKLSQVAGNLPATDSDANRQYLVINGYPVVFSFSKEPNPERYTECGNGRCYKPNHCRMFFDNGIKSVPTFVMKVRNL